MRTVIPEEKSPYSDTSPYKVLGVPATASARELRDARDRRFKEADREFQGEKDQKTRLQRRKAIEDAYAAVRRGKERLSLQVFVLDPSVGKKECSTLAAKHREMSFDYSRVLGHSEQLFRTQPFLPKVDLAAEPAGLKKSLRMCEDNERMAVDPAAAALSEITFPV